ncbi:mechanosensitive ion channel family protein [Patescibacteria group bacterium]|nr:mechanosensitive ion channel family protein [Patescibacteria group bacterium]
MFYSLMVSLTNFFRSISTFLLVFLGSFLFFRIFRFYFLKRLTKIADKSRVKFDDFVIKLIKAIKPFSYFLFSLYLGFQFLETSPLVQRIANAVFVLWLVIQLILLLQVLIDRLLKKYFLSQKKEEESKMAIQLIGQILKAVLWIVGLLLVLSNLGVNITSLVAGLGIGGVAVALALQNILGDLFSSFSIYFDKPFQVGDYIVVGQQSGIVQKIGLKTTRLMALQGEQIVISNRELTSSRIQNFRKMEERRVAFSLGLVYGTTSDQLKKIPLFIEEIIKRQEMARFDRAHFVSFDDSALSLEVVYYVLSQDYNVYRDLHQKILLAIKDKFAQEKIEMAYPTQTLYLQK